MLEDLTLRQAYLGNIVHIIYLILKLSNIKVTELYLIKFTQKNSLLKKLSQIS